MNQGSTDQNRLVPEKFEISRILRNQFPEKSRETFRNPKPTRTRVISSWTNSDSRVRFKNRKWSESSLLLTPFRYLIGNNIKILKLIHDFYFETCINLAVRGSLTITRILFKCRFFHVRPLSNCDRLCPKSDMMTDNVMLILPIKIVKVSSQ